LGILRDFHRLRPDLPVGALVEGDLEPVLRLAEEIPLFSVHMRPETLTRPLLERLSGRGLAVVVFTVNDPRELWRLKAWGVAGIISDYPDRLI
jgi:glycerophosphoryl diester phosphodiesterase